MRALGGQHADNVRAGLRKGRARHTCCPQNPRLTTGLTRSYNIEVVPSVSALSIRQSGVLGGQRVTVSGTGEAVLQCRPLGAASRHCGQSLPTGVVGAVADVSYLAAGTIIIWPGCIGCDEKSAPRVDRAANPNGPPPLLPSLLLLARCRLPSRARLHGQLCIPCRKPVFCAILHSGGADVHGGPQLTSTH